MYGSYTVKLRELMKDEHAAAAINEALSHYPLYTPEKEYDLIPTREELNQKLLNHYKYHEIGFETPGRFIDELNITMCEIMPLYNERFKTIEIMANLENPFDNVDITETYEEERTGETSNNSSATNSGTTKTTETNKTDTTASDQSGTNSHITNTGKSVKSNTPQDAISILANNIDSVSYADEVNWNKNDSTEGSTTTGSSESEVNTTGTMNSESESENTVDSSGSTKDNVHHTLTRKGNHGVNTYAHDMNEFRTSIIDVVNEIIHDKRIAELFMMVF